MVRCCSRSDKNLLQGELAIKNTELAAATKEAEKLLKEISENTAIAEKEKQKVCYSLAFSCLCPSVLWAHCASATGCHLMYPRCCRWLSSWKL